MSEVEKPEAIETTTMSIDRPMVDPSNQTEVGLQLIEERVRVAKQQTAILLRLVSPSQIIVMDGGDGRESVYFTGGAAEKILRWGFGMRFGEWNIDIKRGADETKCTATVELLKEDGSLYERFQGMRYVGGFVRNERDLIKGAKENAKHDAVTSILGLRFLSKADYKELGLDLDRLERRAEFQSHDEDDPGTACVAFGKNKGKPITELNDKQLGWYEKTAKENVANPEKAKWKAKEQKWLDALVAERERRMNPPKTEPAKGESPKKETKPDVDFGPPPMTDEEVKACLEATDPRVAKEEPGVDG